MIEIGCVHGRFQPFHNGHFEYTLAVLARCRKVVVGITQYESDLDDSKSPQHRLGSSDNPFSFWDRMEIIRSVMAANNIEQSRCEIVPFPIHNPSRISNFVPPSCPMFTTVYDEWNMEKIDRLREHGFEVEVLWTREHKAYEGKRVREALRIGDESVKSMLPPGAYDSIRSILNRNKTILNS